MFVSSHRRNRRRSSTQTQTTTQSLAWKDVKVGNGPVIQKDDLITVKHVGTVMESGKSLGEFTFQFQHLEPGRVMPGWSQGMDGMKIGGRRILRIPPKLAYGNRSVGDIIPANSHLEFDVEILNKDESLWSLFLYKTGFKADARTAGILFCLGYLALSPMLESKLNNVQLPFSL
jgi:FKBP-type peptidyl-prolyl cis-trans isomerase